MVGRFESGALLGHVYTLEDGSCVRFRLARSSDALAIRDLLNEAGVDPSPLSVAELVHFDPRRRYVVCATALVNSTERLRGIGAIELGTGEPPEPTLLVVLDPPGDALKQLLIEALAGAATVLGRPRAA
jgi:hypothetical protein